MLNLNQYSSLVKLVLLIVASITLLYVIGFSLRLLMPFVIAFILSAVVRPVAELFRRKFYFGQTLSVWAAMLLVLGVGSLLLFYLFSYLFFQLKRLSLLLPIYTQLAKIEFSHFNFVLNQWIGGISPEYSRIVQKGIENLGGLLNTLFSKILEYFVQLSFGLPDALIISIISIVATFFISRDYEQLKAKMISVIPDQWQQPILQALSNVNIALIKVIKVNALLFSTSFLQMTVGFWLLGIEHYIMVALFITFIDIMPIVGLGLVFVPWIIWSFIASTRTFTLGLIVIYVVCVVTRQFLQPKLYADSFGLDPLVALLAIYIGWRSAGFWGLIFGPVFLMLVLMFYRQNRQLLKEMFRQLKS
ncbi:MAG: sporulation integral membrane protein YtvI [Firmicutes bacterium]|nr:sporulation integral membrane protein YtvI [Bacillota bacterium]